MKARSTALVWMMLLALPGLSATGVVYAAGYSFRLDRTAAMAPDTTAEISGFGFADKIDCTTGVSPISLAIGNDSADITAAYRSGSFTRRWREPAFLRGKADDAGHVSYCIGALKVTPPTRPWVALIGGSNVRECLQQPADLSNELADLTGVRTRVLQLGSTNQNLGETMAIVDNLPPGPGVVVIAVNHTRFAYSPVVVTRQTQGKTLLMPSPALRGFILENQGTVPADTIMPGIKAYWAGWRHKNAAELAAGDKPWHLYLRHRYNAEHIWSSEKKRSRVRLWLDNRGAPGGDFDRFNGFNAEILAAIGTLAADRGYHVVFAEASCDLKIVGTAFDPYRGVYVPVCEKVAADNGGFYVNLNPGAGLASADFRDLTHLVGAGRTKWTTALAAALAPVVTSLSTPTPLPRPLGQRWPLD